jgi:hypothetical protein
MTFESFKKNGEAIEDMQDTLEAWCVDHAKETIGCEPESVGQPDGEEDADGETYNVWVEVEVDEENYNRVKLEMDENYEAFSKDFTQFADSHKCTAQIMCNDDDHTVTFELNFYA